MSGSYESLPTALLDPLFLGALGRTAGYRSPLEGRAPVAAAVAPPSDFQPGAELGDSLSQSSKSVVSPQQTLSAMARSAGIGLGIVASPMMAVPSIFGGLALSQALDQKPSFNARGAISNAVTSPINSTLATDKPASSLDLSTPDRQNTPSVGEYGYGDLGDKSGGEMGLDSSNASEAGGKGGGQPGDKGSDNNFAGGGLAELAGGGKIAMGPGGGLDDLIPTSIQGRQAASLSDGEFVIPADVVSMMGDGSTRAGSQRLYDLVKGVRSEKTGTAQQAGPLPVGDILRRIFG